MLLFLQYNYKTPSAGKKYQKNRKDIIFLRYIDFLLPGAPGGRPVPERDARAHRTPRERQCVPDGCLEPERDSRVFRRARERRGLPEKRVSG